MKKYALLSGIEHQFCINNAINLAALDTFYKKVCVVDKPVNKISSSDEKAENKFNSFSGDHNLNIDVLCNNEIDSNLEDANINEVLQISRSIIRFFRKPSKRNDLLQRYVQEKKEKTLSLILDCGTRWNSLILMTEICAS